MSSQCFAHEVDFGLGLHHSDFAENIRGLDRRNAGHAHVVHPTDDARIVGADFGVLQPRVF